MVDVTGINNLTSEVKCIVIVNGESKANVGPNQTGNFLFLSFLTSYGCTILNNGKICTKSSEASEPENFIVDQDPSDPTGCKIKILQ